MLIGPGRHRREHWLGVKSGLVDHSMTEGEKKKKNYAEAIKWDSKH